MKGQQRHLPGWKFHPDKPGSRKGLRYIASASPEFRLKDGRPNIEAIAAAAGVDMANLHRLRNRPDIAPTGYTVGALVKLAVRVRHVAPITAQGGIFYFFDPEDADEAAEELDELVSA